MQSFCFGGYVKQQNTWMSTTIQAKWDNQRFCDSWQDVANILLQLYQLSRIVVK